MVVDTERNEVDIRSLRSYGIHGALGLLTGIGISLLIVLILWIVISISIPMYFDPIFLLGLGCVLIFVIYGAYVGHIQGGREGSIRLLKPKNMLLLAALGVLGIALGYGVYLVGDNIAAYLNYGLGVNIAIVTILTMVFLLVSIGIPGASIAIGMYFVKGTPYTKRDIPQYLKILRIVGIALALLIILVSSIMVVENAKYASISSVIRIATNGEKTTIYIPVLFDDKGKVLEMYEKPAVSGDAAAAIIETNHGKAFKMSLPTLKGGVSYPVLKPENDSMLFGDFVSFFPFLALR